jgi:hypothetical protein
MRRTRGTGDGIYERVAARVCAEPQDLVKTIKFVDSPSMAQLRRQLRLTAEILPEVRPTRRLDESPWSPLTRECQRCWPPTAPQWPPTAPQSLAVVRGRWPPRPSAAPSGCAPPSQPTPPAAQTVRPAPHPSPLCALSRLAPPNARAPPPRARADLPPRAKVFAHPAGEREKARARARAREKARERERERTRELTEHWPRQTRASTPRRWAAPPVATAARRPASRAGSSGALGSGWSPAPGAR